MDSSENRTDDSNRGAIKRNRTLYNEKSNESGRIFTPTQSQDSSNVRDRRILSQLNDNSPNITRILNRTTDSMVNNHFSTSQNIPLSLNNDQAVLLASRLPPERLNDSMTNAPSSPLRLNSSILNRSQNLFRGRGDQRSMLEHNSVRRQLNVTFDSSLSIGNNDLNTTNNASSKLVIWGTDIVVEECKIEILDFIVNFVPIVYLSGDELRPLNGYDLNQPLYLQKLNLIATTERPFIDLDSSHLQKMKPNLYNQLIIYPLEVIPTFDIVFNEQFLKLYPSVINSLGHQINTRVFNLVDRTQSIRELNPEDIDKLITINGLVIRCSGLIPEMQEAFFECFNCKQSKSVEIENGRISEPTTCRNCNTSHSMSLIHNRSIFSDKQVIKLQESPDDMPAGQTPYTILIFSHNELVDSVQPGDRVTVTGIFRANPVRPNPRQRTVRSVYRTYVDALHFQKYDKNRLHTGSSDAAISEDRDYDSNNEQINLTQDRIEYLKQLSLRSDIYDSLANSIAPSIYGNIDVKKGILLQLFGGTNKDFKENGRGHFRSEINILLCGDPGTSKSQILKYVNKIVPRGQYTSGKGSSAAGLTVYVTKDPDTKQMVLQTGAIVMSDNGVCCIDEFDKMNESTRSILHEVMEQQTLSIAKAGIICQLNARASILAAANPVKSRWDTNLNTVENIKLPHTLLSRFDLIFLILDSQDSDFDAKLASHLVSLYISNDIEDNNIQDDRRVDFVNNGYDVNVPFIDFLGSNDQEKLMILDMNTIKDYVAFAKSAFKPKLSSAAAQRLVQIYVDMRRIGSANGAVTAYPRQLESLIRLSEAHAKMRFATCVDISDVEEAIRLHKEALKQSCVDPKTGLIDINILATGVTTSDVKARTDMARLIQQICVNKSKTVHSRVFTSDAIFNEIKNLQPEKKLSLDMFDSAISILVEENIISITNKTIHLLT